MLLLLMPVGWAGGVGGDDVAEAVPIAECVEQERDILPAERDMSRMSRRWGRPAAPPRRRRRQRQGRLQLPI